MIKDLLLSLDDLPPQRKYWPKAGDKVMVEMVDRKNQLYGRIIGRKQITDHFEEQLELEDKAVVEAHVMYIIDNGIVCFTEDGHEIFIHHNNYRHYYRIGELVTPKILKRNPSGEYVGSLIEQKELMLEKDAEVLIDYLEKHRGTMAFTDKRDAQAIFETFHMSKSAFKRALGNLFKAGLIELNETNTKKIDKLGE